MENNILQMIKEDLSLKDLINSEFTEILENNFENMKIEPVSLQFTIEKSGKFPRTITLFHRDKNSTNYKMLYLDAESPKDFKKLLNSVESV